MDHEGERKTTAEALADWRGAEQAAAVARRGRVAAEAAAEAARVAAEAAIATAVAAKAALESAAFAEASAAKTAAAAKVTALSTSADLDDARAESDLAEAGEVSAKAEYQHASLRAQRESLGS